MTGRTAGTIFHEERLAKPLREPLTHQPGDNVGLAASGSGNNDTDRPRRIGLRACIARDGRERGSTRGQMQKLPSVGEFHGALLFSRRFSRA
jgi:hypothetical protein